MSKPPMPDAPQLDNQTDDPGSLPRVFAGLGRSASLISLGNIAGRILGVVREMVIAAYFGATGEVSAFRVASQVPTMIYDLLAGGMLSAAIVPTLSEYSAPERRPAFIQLISTLLTSFAVVLALLTVLLEVTAPQIAQWFRTAPSLLGLTTQMLRIVLPTVWFISMAGIVTGILYAQERFTFPAMAAAIFNLGIVVTAPLLAPRFGIFSLAVGMLIGSIGQLLVMGWDLSRFLREEGLRLPLFRLENHPALRKIVRLYLPIAGVTLFSTGQIALDRRLANTTGVQSIAWMQNATTLQQLPLGLISIAIALASLPRLSHYFAAKEEGAYRATLGAGLRLVMLLIAPAAVILWVLGEPIVRIIFERGKFLPDDTMQVLSAMQIYVVGMLFAAIDFPLNYAFYARNNTLLPALAGVASIFMYGVAAFSLIDSMGYLGLVWADTIKQAAHMFLMLFVLWWQVGRLQADVVQAGIKVLMSASAMAAFIWFAQRLMQPYLLVTDSPLLSDLFMLVSCGGLGVLLYGSLLKWLGVREVKELLTAVFHKRRAA